MIHFYLFLVKSSMKLKFFLEWHSL